MKLAITMLCFLVWAPDQDDVVKNISSALEAGSAKELVKFCADNVGIKIDGKTSNYSLNQAEVVLRDFFQKNHVKGYVHDFDGTPKDEKRLMWASGNMQVDNGNYLVIMLIKKFDDQFKVDQIIFSKE